MSIDFHVYALWYVLDTSMFCGAPKLHAHRMSLVPWGNFFPRFVCSSEHNELVSRCYFFADLTLVIWGVIPSYVAIRVWRHFLLLQNRVLKHVGLIGIMFFMRGPSFRKLFSNRPRMRALPPKAPITSRDAPMCAQLFQYTNIHICSYSFSNETPQELSASTLVCKGFGATKTG